MEDSVCTVASAPASHLVPLMKSFSFVPPASVPAIIECVLASSVLSVSNLFSFLLQSFTDFDESHQANYMLCCTSALCHLVKKDGAPSDAMNQLISTFFIPLLKVIDPSNSELLNETEELVYHSVFETGSWELMGKTLVPYCLSSAGFRIGAILDDDMYLDKQSTETSFEPLGTLPRKTALRVLTYLLEFSLKSWRQVATSEQKMVNLSSPLDAFIVNLTGQLSSLALWLLKLSADDRLHAIHLILPIVLRSLNVLSAFKGLEHELQCSISRAQFFESMWSSCSSLFQLGHLERRDAYWIISLYFSLFYESGGHEKFANINIDEEFDLRGNAILWEQVQIGLVDRDSSVRKMALYLLKALVNCYSSSLSGNDQCFPNSQPPAVDAKNVAIMTQDRNTPHVGLTKREKWAEKEAKSMGVGGTHFDGLCSNGVDRWRIFVLLYEMLEEYGTHLVEAAWTHQVSLLFQCCPLNNDEISTTVGVYYAQMETLDGLLGWFTVLWERGFFHENPQVRCLIMESFLGIDWDRCGNLAQKVPRSFVLGPFVRGLNDVVHHKDFELEMEDQLLGSALQARKEVMEKFSESQQQIILVASLLDRIPNLAGLARTCEVFRAACLAVADSSIVLDKQFQLISVTAEKWIPIIEVPVSSIKVFLEKKRREGFSILGLEQTANSTVLDKFVFPNKTVLVLGREKEGIPVDIIHVLDACVEIPQMGVIRSLNVHVSGAIAIWEYTRQQRGRQNQCL